MNVLRTVARVPLLVVIRLAPPKTKPWAVAMLREMDAIEGDWAAFRWSFGGVVALFRQSIIDRASALDAGAALESWSSQRRGRRLAIVLAGVVVAMLCLVVSALALAGLGRTGWFEGNAGRLVTPLLLVVIPDAACVAGAVALWHARRRMAFAMVAAGATLAIHSIIFFVA